MFLPRLSVVSCDFFFPEAKNKISHKNAYVSLHSRVEVTTEAP